MNAFTHPTGVEDGAVYIWDARLIWDADTDKLQPDDPDISKLEPDLIGQTDAVQAVAIGRIGDRPVIVSAGGTDQTVRVWDAVTFEPRLVLFGLSEEVHAVAVEQVDGQIMIFVGGHDRVQAI